MTFFPLVRNVFAAVAVFHAFLFHAEAAPPLSATSIAPARGASSVLPDTRLSITFNQPVSVGATGFIKIYDTAEGTVVDTVDLAAATELKNTLRATSELSTRDLPVQTKSIGGLDNFHYYPITISGNTATIYPRDRALAYGRSYAVTIDAGVFTDVSGAAFPGVADRSLWTFSTTRSGPAPRSPRLTVATDGSGDFHTVQGALDSIPADNTAPIQILLRDGTYFETIYFSGKHNLTFLGQSRTGAIIEYPNNNNFNNVPGVYHRSTFYGNNVSGITLANLTVLNSTPQKGSQAEAVILTGSATTARNIITHADLLSYQDTVQFNGQVYVQHSRIEGDVDFMWGSGPAYLNNCDIKMLRPRGGYFTQIRNPATNHGFVFVDCTLTSVPGEGGHVLARIDPASFPHSEVVWINCQMGDFIAPAGWKFDKTTDGPEVRFWEHHSTDAATGRPLDVSQRLPASRQLTRPADAATITNYRDPSYVLGGDWPPILPSSVSAYLSR